jgi:hypothetical protein
MNSPTGVIHQKRRNQLSAYFDTRDRVRWTSSLKRLTEDAAQEYEGRFLIELVQNAYDAHLPGTTDGAIEVFLDLQEGDHGTLYVANTGRPFSEQNFNAITDIAQSNKPPGEGIGNKGVGFKSVLQVSEWPEVYSAFPGESTDDAAFDGFCFRFATPVDIENLVHEPEQAAQVIRDISPYLLPVPIERTPGQLLAYRCRGFCTVVRLPLRSAKAAATAEHEVRELAASKTPVLLFLDRIANLRLRVRNLDGSSPVDDELLRSTRPIKSSSCEDRLALSEVDLGAQGRFVLATRPVSTTELRDAINESVEEHQIDARWAEWSQDAAVSVAAKIDASDDEWRLYTFLPMENSPAPLAAHANAPFFTKLARSSVSFAVPLNDFLLNEIAHLSIDAALWRLSRSSWNLRWRSPT